MGSERVSRVGERVLAIANFFVILGSRTKIVSARHRNQHARRVRYPLPNVYAFVGGANHWRTVRNIKGFLELRQIRERSVHAIMRG